MTFTLDFSPAGLLDAAKRFGFHALIVAALAGVTDLYVNFQHITISNHTALGTVAFALIASFLQNTGHFLATQKAASEAATPVLNSEFAG